MPVNNGLISGLPCPPSPVLGSVKNLWVLDYENEDGLPFANGYEGEVTYNLGTELGTEYKKLLFGLDECYYRATPRKTDNGTFYQLEVGFNYAQINGTSRQELSRMNTGAYYLVLEDFNGVFLQLGQPGAPLYFHGSQNIEALRSGKNESNLRFIGDSLYLPTVLSSSSSWPGK